MEVVNVKFDDIELNYNKEDDTVNLLLKDENSKNTIKYEIRYNCIWVYKDDEFVTYIEI